MKIKKSFYPWAMSSLICMLFIFWFSSQSAEKSGELSGAITHGIFEATLSWFEKVPFIDDLEVIVRKTAHIFIFFVLGFCVTNAVRQITQKKQYIFCISLAWCSFYAATDEWHQYFVPGRACMVQDWVIDTIGVLLGIGAAFIFHQILRVKFIK